MKRLAILFTTIPLALLLIGIILCSTVENLHSTLLDVGETHWHGYSQLRQEAVKPDCNPEQAAGAGETDEEDALLDDLFGESEEGASQEAVEAANAVCRDKIAQYDRIVHEQQNGALQAFVGFEKAVGNIASNSVAYGKHFLILVFIFCGLATTLQRQHLGLRAPSSRLSDRVSQVAQLVGNLVVTGSFFVYYRQDLASGVEHVSNLPVFWMIGFGLMALANMVLICRPLGDKAGEGGRERAAQILLGIPLYAYMALVAGIYFCFVEGHYAGIGIYLNQMTEHADLYTNVALYVFCGMMLKYTDIADRFLAILRPFHLSAEILVFVIVILSAVPTAYSGASGIFVIAAGAIIYRELKQSGARDGLALAGTAMSGSMGIVLSPCLLVVIIAALNKDVTTGEMFHAGMSVFFVNIFVFAVVLFATHKDRMHWGECLKAVPDAWRALLKIAVYVAIAAAVLLALNFGIGAKFDEYSAPAILPFVLLVLLVYDRLLAKNLFRRGHLETEAPASKFRKLFLPADVKEGSAPDGVLRSLFQSVNATSIHSGGLLSLMTLSICIGGIIDRANIQSYLPQHFSSPIAAMAVLFVILVVIGMIMDPYGAVILVSATLTQVAYSNGIAPLHFWMTVLCAFELGYLTPPVALNQLLTRQVVGEEAYAYEGAQTRPQKFWYRHERILLPMAVKGIVLLLVAFLPLVLNKLHWMQF